MLREDLTFPASQESWLSGFLELSDGGQVPVTNGMTIGRVAGNGVVLEDGKVSRRHARLIVEFGVVEVEDLGSSNGTLLNGKRVERKVLRDGDRLMIGRSALVYRERDAVAPAPVAADHEPEVIEFEFEDEVVDVAPPPPTPPPPTPPPPAPPPPTPTPQPDAAEVIEFEDEMVQVRPREEPRVERRASAEPSARTGAATAGRSTSEHGVLQFNKQRGSGGVFGDDLNQVGGVGKLVMILVGIGFAVGLGYLAMRLAG